MGLNILQALVQGDKKKENKKKVAPNLLTFYASLIWLSNFGFFIPRVTIHCSLKKKFN